MAKQRLKHPTRPRFLLDRAISFMALLCLAGWVTQSTAFSVTPFRHDVSQRSKLSTATSWRLTTHSTRYSTQENYVDDVDDEDDPKERWLRWMIGGKPRGTSKIEFREAEELGGLPRANRYSSRDWFHVLATVPNSATLHAIRSPVMAVTIWSALLSLVHLKLRVSRPALAARMYFPGSPHALMMSALSLLLVFRTNSAYQRFNEG